MRLGTAPHVIERILNHVSGSFAGVGGVYNRHAYLEEMRISLQQWSDWVRELKSGEVHVMFSYATRSGEKQNYKATRGRLFEKT